MNHWTLAKGVGPSYHHYSHGLSYQIHPMKEMGMDRELVNTTRRSVAGAKKKI